MFNIKKNANNKHVQIFYNITLNIISSKSRSKKIIMKLLIKLIILKILKTTLNIFIYTSKTKNVYSLVS